MYAWPCAQTLEYLAPELARRNLAYVCVSSLNSPPYATHVGLPGANIAFDPWAAFRAAGYNGVLMANGGFAIETAEATISGTPQAFLKTPPVVTRCAHCVPPAPFLRMAQGIFSRWLHGLCMHPPPFSPFPCLPGSGCTPGPASAVVLGRIASMGG